MSGRIWGRAASVAVLSLGLAASGTAQTYSYRYAYVHHVTGELTLQRASEPEPEVGEINVPLVPGDRLWTHAASRAEIRFADGTLLRMDEHTKVDLVAFEEEQTVRLWSGSVILKLREPRTDVRIDTPSGTVYPAADGLFRVDVREGERTTLSTVRGVAELVSDAGSVLVRGGQRSVLEPGRRPDSPFAFNTARFDEFDAWSEERERYASTTHGIAGELPREIHHYAPKLSHHGEWHHEPSYGRVWYPRVALGWAPYRHGKWRHTSFGFTWIPYEPWGWVPFHYGRWGFGHRGWFWIPGSHWSPAWVSWAFGPTWLGWSPLGHHDRPVFVFNTFLHGHGGRKGFHGRKAVPRHVFDHGAGWNFAHRREFRRGGSAGVRLRPNQVRGMASNVRVLESGAVLERDLSPRAVGRTGLSRVAAGTPFRQAPRRAVTRGLAEARRGEAGSPNPRNSGTGIGERRVAKRETGAVSRESSRPRASSREARGPQRIERTRARERQSTREGVVRRGTSRARPEPSRVIRTPSSRGPSSIVRSPGRVREGSRRRGEVGREPSSSPPRRTTTPPRSRGRESFERSGQLERATRSPSRVRDRSRSRVPRGTSSRSRQGLDRSRSSTSRSRETVSGGSRPGSRGLRSRPGGTTRSPGTIRRGGAPPRGTVQSGGARGSSSKQGAAGARSRGSGNRSQRKN